MDKLQEVADLIQRRNAIDAEIGTIIQRPASIGHLGEWIAGEVFGINLEPSATQKAWDGRFTREPLAGRTVNVKWYGKYESLLDIRFTEGLDFYLVMTGRRATTMTSKGQLRPLEIASVYLFDTQALLTMLTVKLSVATSIRKSLWTAAEIYPAPTNPLLTLTDEQRAMLALFAPRS